MTRVAVVGAGAWGTALADVLARNGHDTTLWAIEPDVAERIRSHHENARFLPGVTLHPSLGATTNLDEALAEATLVCVAVPSQHVRAVLRRAAGALANAATLCVASKGIEVGTLSLMNDVAESTAPHHQVVALSGPSFAAEVAARQPTAIVAASTDVTAAERVQEAFSNHHLRVYTHDDVIGVELGGALKNVLAIGAGIAEGLKFGHNTRAALITRGLAEMSRIGLKMGANPLTFAGLGGLGDLILTCTGDLSRNRKVGLMLGEGKSLQEVLGSMDQVAEGVKTARSVEDLSRKVGIEMPLCHEVYCILYENKDARKAVMDLMGRDLKDELA